MTKKGTIPLRNLLVRGQNFGLGPSTGAGSGSGGSSMTLSGTEYDADTVFITHSSDPNYINQFAVAKDDLLPLIKEKSVNFVGDSALQDMHFAQNGSLMFLADGVNHIVKYELGIPYDISTANRIQTSQDLSTFATYTIEAVKGIYLSEDGYAIYLLSIQGYMYRCALPNAFDLDGLVNANFTNQVNLDNPANKSVSYEGGFFFKPDGTRLFMAFYGDDYGIVEFSLSTPFDIATLTYLRNVDVRTSEYPNLQAHEVFFNNSGTTAYLVDIYYGRFITYNLGVPWDITTLQEIRNDSEASAATGITVDFTPKSIYFNILEDFENANVGTLPAKFTQFGDAGWEVTAEQSFYGNHALVSTDISDGQTAGISFDIDVQEGMLLTFRYRVSSESGYDFFRCYLNDTIILEDSGGMSTGEFKTFTKELSTGSYTLKFTYEKDGSVSSNEDRAFIDIIATEVAVPERPFQPRNVTTTDFTLTDITISWDPVLLPNISGYNVYVDGVKVNNALIVSGTTYTIDNLNEGTQYQVEVTAIDWDGDESDKSIPIAPQTADSDPPSAPTGLSAKSAGDTKVDLSWTANSEYDLEGYNVYVDGIKNNGALISGTTYQVSGLNKNQSYDFYITAVDVLGNESDPSATVSQAPTGITDFAVALNGVDQYINSGNTDFGNYLAEFTVEMQFWNTESVNKVTFIGTADDGNSTILQLKLNEDGGGNINPNYICFHLRDSNGVQRRMATTAAHPSVSDGAKHHIAFTKTGQEYHIILDGVDLDILIGVSGSDNNPSTFTAVQYPIFIGANDGRGAPNKYLNGGLDEIRWWTDLRTIAEIQNNMNQSLNPQTDYATDYPNLFAYYKCDDGAGNVLTNEVGANATLVNNVNDNMWVASP